MVADTLLGRSTDVEENLGVYIEDDKVSTSGWEDGLGVSSGAIINKESLPVVSTYIGTYAMTEVKSIVVPFLGDMTPPTSDCPWYSQNSSF